MHGKEPLLAAQKDSGLDGGVRQEPLPSEEACSQGGSRENEDFALTLFPSPFSWTVFHWPHETTAIPAKDPIGMNPKAHCQFIKSLSRAGNQIWDAGGGNLRVFLKLLKKTLKAHLLCLPPPIPLPIS